MAVSVYVGTYAKYNEGSIQGEWVTLSEFTDMDGFLEKCREIHSDEKDPEFMFQDIEGPHFGLVSEGHIDPKIFEIYSELSEDEIEAFEAYTDAGLGNDVDGFRDAYQGEWDSDKEFAQALAEETGAIQRNVSWPYTCIDWDWAVREIMYDYTEQNRHYFRNS